MAGNSRTQAIDGHRRGCVYFGGQIVGTKAFSRLGAGVIFFQIRGTQAPEDFLLTGL